MSSKDTTIQALMALFLAFPAQERSGNERELVKVYMLAVEGIDQGFVAMACRRFVQGQVPRQNFTWRPTPAELAVEARELQAKAGARERIAALPSRASRTLPKPDPVDPTPEERARCAEMWARTKAQIEAAHKASKPPRKGWAPPPDYAPKFDVSDFPEPGWSSERLRAWEARQKASAA